MNLFGSTKAQQYKTHRWIAVIIGVFILWQAFSGSVWVLPFPSPASRLHPRSKPIQSDSIKVSPKTAVRNLENHLQKELIIRSIQIESIKDIAYYKIKDNKGTVHFVDVETGKILEMSEELAVALVSAHFPKEVPPIKKIHKINEHDLSYLAGPLPAYRIEFDHRHGFISHVSVNESTIQHSDRYNRIRRVIVGMHDMSLLMLLWKHSLFYRLVLCVFALVATGAAITGYYLAIKRPRRKPKFSHNSVIS